MSKKNKDAGAHYRFTHKVKLTKKDIKSGFVIVKVDPFRIAKIYGMTSFALMTVLKKCLCAGARGYKNHEQDLMDIRSACDRELEIILEDKT